MREQRCRIICFSPTGGTRKITEAIAEGLGLPSVMDAITLTRQRENISQMGPDDLILLAAPVYYGRVAATAAEFFSRLKGQGQNVVLVANYGNRHYDDALVELFDLAVAAGLRPIAAGAFISEHSFSTPAFPMAQSRPDPEDLSQAKNFGSLLLAKLQAEAQPLLEVPGARPYRPYPDFHRAPVTSESCTACGMCMEVCPVDAIVYDGTRYGTVEERCIICQACVKSCPEGAREDRAQGAVETRQRLQTLVAEKRSPEFFM